VAGAGVTLGITKLYADNRDWTFTVPLVGLLAASPSPRRWVHSPASTPRCGPAASPPPKPSAPSDDLTQITARTRWYGELRTSSRRAGDAVTEEHAMPEPVLVSVATAVASKAALDLYGLVKRRFGRDPKAQEALDAAADDPTSEERVLALAEEITRLEQLDADFAREVRAGWEAEQAKAGPVAQDDGVVNQISSSVVGRSFQGRDVQGDVRF
jgi:hypothetical protein